MKWLIKNNLRDTNTFVEKTSNNTITLSNNMLDSSSYSNYYPKENATTHLLNINNTLLEHGKCIPASTLDSISYSIPKKSSLKTLIFNYM